jgi:hypothetical protein
VRNKVILASPLPVRQRAQIQKIPGFEAVTALTYFVRGKFNGRGNTYFANSPSMPETAPRVFGEANIPPDPTAAFIATAPPAASASTTGKSTV